MTFVVAPFPSFTDTGRLVGTGTGGAAAARTAIGRAQLQLAEEANVHLHVRNFAVRLFVSCETRTSNAENNHAQVINQVGAASLRATLNCDAFAREHSAESHFDRSSFVGLAWRPPREHICCGARLNHSLDNTPHYQLPPLLCARRNLLDGPRQVSLTQHSIVSLQLTLAELRWCTRARSLPGSTTERQLLESFSRMLPELLRFSSAAHLLGQIPDEMQAHHRIKHALAATAVAAPAQQWSRIGRSGQHRMQPQAVAPQAQQQGNIWDGWGEAGANDPNTAADSEDEFSGVDDLGL